MTLVVNASSDVDHMADVADKMGRRARHGVYRGHVSTPGARDYFESCRRYDRRTGTFLIFTRDAGHHTSGWWKNPDYEHCLHLSLSFFDAETGAPRDRDVKLSAAWVRAFFGDWRRLVWAEPPYSDRGLARDVWHYRVFTTPTYREPILPRGEVYSTELTERGWLSYSDLRYEKEQWPMGGQD